jgi:ankyrin repeat protein
VETLLNNYFISVSKRECLRECWDGRIKEAMSWFGMDWDLTLNEYVRGRSFNLLHIKLLALDSNTVVDLEEFLQTAEESGYLSELINHADAQGRTPLTWAVEYHHERGAELLIKYGADVNHRRRTRSGVMPLLHLLCAAPRVSQRLLVLLLRAGADVNAQDDEGWTVAHITASWSDKVSLRSIREETEGLDLSVLNFEGQTARHLAEDVGGDEELLGLLI